MGKTESAHDINFVITSKVVNATDRLLYVVTMLFLYSFVYCIVLRFTLYSAAVYIV